VIRSLAGALPIAPAAALGGGVVALAWREQGSVLAEDWLPYAVGACLLVATVLVSGAALRPAPGPLVGLAAFTVLAVWTGLSALWSPVPSLARDEALLVLFYALVLAVPLLTLRSDGERYGAIGIVVAASVLLVLATSVRLLTADEAADLYWGTRLGSPIRYPGAEAALFLVSFWPAVALAASRRLTLALRPLAFGGAVALLAGWLMTQSRAGAVSLVVSAVIVFAIAPARLRLLVPVALAAAMAGASYYPLTEPFRAEPAAFEQAIQDAGRWALVLSAAGIAIGLVYALADRRLEVPRQVVRAAGFAAVGAVVVGTLAGPGAFVVAVDKPGDYLEDRWERFKRAPEAETGSSHLITIGSNRYDLWRVALDEFRDHPVAGTGGRAFGAAYLREGDTNETPQRGHSLELDVLSETGIVGLALLLAALVPFVFIVLRRARLDLVSTGVLGGITYSLVHASGDWTWTFPAAGLPFLLLLGAGAAGGRDRRITPGIALPLGVVLAVAALLIFAPPWLSSRYTARALEQPASQAADELRWARRLDPLSTDPLVAEAEIADSPKQAIPPLLEAVEREPRTMAPRYLLGLAYLDAGRLADSRRELREALRLSPRSEAVRRALARVRDRQRAPS
jgi:O-Antigen ligase